MNLTTSEQFVLSRIAAGILQAGQADGLISTSQWDSYVRQACSELGTSFDYIFSINLDVDPFATIRRMSSQQKNFVKSFLYRWHQKVSSSERATYYFVSTLEQGGCIINI